MAQRAGAVFSRSQTAGAASLIFAPYVARADVPVIRYATSGGIGANGIDTLFFTDYMRKNVLKRYGKDYTIEVTYTRGTPEAASLMAAGQVDLAAQSCPSLATAIARNAIASGLTAIADIHDVRPRLLENAVLRHGKQRHP